MTARILLFQEKGGHRTCEKFARICNFAQVLRISNEQSPIANLDYPFAFSNIADAKGCYRLPIGDC
jgi:hypothetical protein